MISFKDNLFMTLARRWGRLFKDCRAGVWVGETDAVQLSIQQIRGFTVKEQESAGGVKLLR